MQSPAPDPTASSAAERETLRFIELKLEELAKAATRVGQLRLATTLQMLALDVARLEAR